MKTIKFVNVLLFAAFLFITFLISETASENLFLWDLPNIALYGAVLAGGARHWGIKQAEANAYGVGDVMVSTYTRKKNIFFLIVLTIAVAMQTRFFIVHCWPLLVL